MTILQYVKRGAHCLRLCLDNLLMNALPDCWLSSRFLRPALARTLGMKCGHKTLLRRGSYYGNLRNISIGDGTGVNRDVFFDATDRITLGSNVCVGYRVTFVTGTHEIGPPARRCGALVAKPITVEDGVWIGACATIGPGVTIRAGSVVSVGAVVMRSVPPNSLVMGVPARFVMQLKTLASSHVPTLAVPTQCPGPDEASLVERTASGQSVPFVS